MRRSSHTRLTATRPCPRPAGAQSGAGPARPPRPLLPGVTECACRRRSTSVWLYVCRALTHFIYLAPPLPSPPQARSGRAEVAGEARAHARAASQPARLAPRHTSANARPASRPPAGACCHCGQGWGRRCQASPKSDRRAVPSRRRRQCGKTACAAARSAGAAAALAWRHRAFGAARVRRVHLFAKCALSRMRCVQKRKLIASGGEET